MLFKEAGGPPGKHIHLHTHLRTQTWKCPGYIFQHNVKVNMQAGSDCDSCFFKETLVSTFWRLWVYLVIFERDMQLVYELTTGSPVSALRVSTAQISLHKDACKKPPKSLHVFPLRPPRLRNSRSLPFFGHLGGRRVSGGFNFIKPSVQHGLACFHDVSR